MNKLHNTDKKTYIDKIKAALDHGVDVNRTLGRGPAIFDGITMLHFACLKSDITSASFLIDHGADLDIPPYNNKALSYASMTKDTGLVSLLVENGAEVTQEILNTLDQLYSPVFKQEVIDSAQKFKDLYEYFRTNDLDSFDKIESTLNMRWAVYKKYFKSQNVVFPTLSNFKMFITEDLKTNLLKNADFCKFLSLPSDIFQAESLALALPNSFSKKYNAFTEVVAEMAYSHTPTETNLLQFNMHASALTKMLSISDLMRFIIGFAPKPFAIAVTLKLLSIEQDYNQIDPAPAEIYGEEESKSDMVLTGTDNVSTSEL